MPLIQNFRRASVPPSYAQSPPPPSGVSVTYENERISKKNSLPYLKCDRRDTTHILSKVSFFLFKSFHFHWLQKRQVFSPYKSLYCESYATMPMLIFRAWAACAVTKFCYKSVNLFFEKLINIKLILFLIHELFR